MIENTLLDDEYKKQLIETIHETYPKYIQQELLSSLEKKGVVKLRNKKALNENANRVDLSNVEEDQQLVEGLNNNQILNALEKREFYKSYHFSVINIAVPSDENIFEKLEVSGEIQNFLSEDYRHDLLFSESEKPKPTMLNIRNVVILKFSKLLHGYTQLGQKSIKYCIIGIYFKHLGILEIRLDKAKNIFHSDDLFYHHHIEDVVNWFRNTANFNIETLNLPPVINFINKKDQDEVIIHSQAMSMSSGAKAVLDTGQSGNSILPLLGELKELIKVNEELFDESPKIKSLIENFISETESTSDLPWISLRWKGNDKNDTVVKFKHNYYDKGYTLLSYYGRQTDMEKMDYVTRNIIKNREELNRLEALASAEAEEAPFNNTAV